MRKMMCIQVTAYVSAFLLDGASPSATDEYGNTPLHLAAKRAFTQCAKELLKWGADAHKENDNLETPLELSLSIGLLLKDNERMADFSKFAAMIALEMRPPKYIML
jgi:ankyrin repeat protein